MKRSVYHYCCIFVGVALFAALVQATADPAEVIALANTVMTRNSNIAGVSVSAVDVTGMRSDVSVAVGAASSDANFHMRPNIAVRAGTYGELLQNAVTLQLIAAGTLPQLDETIPSRLLPGGLTFVNPNFPGLPLTLRMLMTHTSSIQDSVRFDQIPSLVTSGTTATDLRTFATSYYLTTVAGSSTIATDIWTTSRPGLAASYRFARSNIALLSYVLQLIISENPSLTTVQTVGSLVQQRVADVVGMTGTYSMLPDGSIPVVQTGLSVLSSSKQVEPSTFPNHAAYLADYMTLTSADDMARLAYYLFIQSSTTTLLSVAGSTMLTSTNLITLASTDATRGGVTKQGLGIVQFDAVTLCGYWTAAGGSGLTCPFSASRPVYGYTNQNQAATIAFLCQKTLATTISVGTAAPVTTYTCVSATLTRTSTSTTTIPVATALAVIGEAFKQLSSSTLNDDLAVGVIFPSDQLEGLAYGFSVFAILMVVFNFILLLSYVVEFIVRPVALTGPVVSSAYPKLDAVMDEEDEASPLRLGMN